MREFRPNSLLAFWLGPSSQCMQGPFEAIAMAGDRQALCRGQGLSANALFELFGAPGGDRLYGSYQITTC